MRRMCGAGNVVAEERFVRGSLIDPAQVIDGVTRHASNQVPARLALERIDLSGVAEEVRLPLVGVAADESVEILEALSDRPIVKRPDLTGVERWHVVIFAKPRGCVAVVLQDAADGRLILRNDAVVAR